MLVPPLTLGLLKMVLKNAVRRWTLSSWVWWEKLSELGYTWQLRLVFSLHSKEHLGYHYMNKLILVLSKLYIHHKFEAYSLPSRDLLLNCWENGWCPLRIPCKYRATTCTIASHYNLNRTATWGSNGPLAMAIW